MFDRSYIYSHRNHPHYISKSKLFSLQKSIRFSTKEVESIKVVRNLTDPTKLRIYLILHKIKGVPVTDLSGILNLSQSTVSHALADLKNIGLVKSYRCGKLICYSLNRGKKRKKLLNFLINLKTYEAF
ncbi:MAG: metalloregulator ArsR/SmtB family transcription factor [Patescibacteria group bacterium]